MKDKAMVRFHHISFIRRRYSGRRSIPARQQILVFTVFILAILLTVFFMKSTTTKAADDRIRTVSSVKIHADDTLWDIASAYYTDEYKDVWELVREIQQINGLTDDHIEAGNSIIVPHYIDGEVPTP